VRNAESKGNLMKPTMREKFFEVPTNSSLESLAEYGEHFANVQRDCLWWLGDLARYAESKWPETYHQIFPEWISPGLVARCAGVAKAYPNESDRNLQATWTQHMRLANDPGRITKVAAIVEAGLTSDESAKETADINRPRWLLAIDVPYWLHRTWYSGAGVEAAKGVSDWIDRLVSRLKEKGLTDVVCAFDGRDNFRKDLTKDWEDRYKPRPPKDPELVHQLQLVEELLASYCCVKLDTYEADDVMASHANQFDGRVTILSQDKDLRQCLCDKVNMLLDVDWTEDATSGDMLPEYKWLSAKQHTEATGLRPDQWAEFQSVMGDSVDGVKGIVGVGEKGAADLIKEFGTIEAIIQAARDNDERIKPKKREAIVEFEPKLEATRQLVTLKTDLRIPQDTRLT